MNINFTGLTAKEGAFIIAALAELPIKQCGELYAKLSAQLQNQIAAAAVPAAPPANAE